MNILSSFCIPYWDFIAWTNSLSCSPRKICLTHLKRRTRMFFTMSKLYVCGRSRFFSRVSARNSCNHASTIWLLHPFSLRMVSFVRFQDSQPYVRRDTTAATYNRINRFLVMTQGWVSRTGARDSTSWHGFPHPYTYTDVVKLQAVHHRRRIPWRGRWIWRRSQEHRLRIEWWDARIVVLQLSSPSLCYPLAYRRSTGPCLPSCVLSLRPCILEEWSDLDTTFGDAR